MNNHRITTAKCENNTDIAQGMKIVLETEHPYISIREYLSKKSLIEIMQMTTSVSRQHKEIET